MPKYQYISLIVLLLMGSFALSGCLNRTTPAEEMFETLERVVQIEQNFEEQQAPLLELEKQEKDIYEKIIELNMQDYDEVVRLADQAIVITEKRKEHIEREHESMQESREAFNEVNAIIEKLEDKGLQKQAEELYDLMQQRYVIHDKLYKHYSEGLESDKELYNLFKKEDLTIEKLGEQINKVNESYEKVLDANQEFNDVTDKYNQKKLDFYKAADLNVQVNE
ncbi:YkyA family protein [Mesobacillus maritimus]|uniref:YkyA family protein n=1 Tax=Mesobacillus maritimus TaxID=1643336 RepID=UPI00203EF666|nr:YkyA family protein [Mesobacillus maritimus]MCM3586266.1 YkyA family protein [Mesobacillus maritimus]